MKTSNVKKKKKNKKKNTKILKTELRYIVRLANTKMLGAQNILKSKQQTLYLTVRNSKSNYFV